MYIDTSVAVKLFTPEPDSQESESIVADSSLVSSQLLHCELRTALHAKTRNNLISPAMMASAWEKFEQYVQEHRIILISFDDALVREAAVVVDRVHPDIPLRTLDALHLATFLRMDAGPLFTKDKRMRAAAAQLSIPLAD
jgi:predicted nucleic acid-binding protein